jgi:hypothetical protein
LKSNLFGNRGSISYANLLDPNSFLPSSHVPFHDLDETMSPQQQDNQRRDQEKQARQQRKTVIGKLVIHTLGQPGHLHEVQVRHLWEDRYRVNILVGLDAASVRVAHSYFLVADSDGNIVASTPKITRQY